MLKRTDLVRFIDMDSLTNYPIFLFDGDELYLDEVLLYYNNYPYLFVCKDKNGKYYLAQMPSPKSDTFFVALVDIVDILDMYRKNLVIFDVFFKYDSVKKFIYAHKEVRVFNLTRDNLREDESNYLRISQARFEVQSRQTLEYFDELSLLAAEKEMEYSNEVFYVDEIFLSIQGESRDSGLPTTFIRMFGCNIGCTYCDQKQYRENCKKMSLSEIIKKVVKLGVRRVCLTGGEPLEQYNIYLLIAKLNALSFELSIETSGCVPLIPLPYNGRLRYVMDIKCPSSGVVEKNLYNNLGELRDTDEVKFVIKDLNDYNFMREILKKFPTPANILVSPMFDGDNKMAIGKSLVEWILRDKLNCRVQVQIHKVLDVK